MGVENYLITQLAPGRRSRISACVRRLCPRAAAAIQRAARRNGMRVLREDGARQVIAGITSIEEVLAATQAGEM
jgi:type II secretory ATPase GspE/PulE/Tfp pilus assembly ATPase PilB-like protein